MHSSENEGMAASMRMRRSSYLGLLFIVVGCGTEGVRALRTDIPGTTPADAGAKALDAATQTSAPDATADASDGDAGRSLDAGDAGDATGPLSNVVLEYRGKTVTFDRAYFGYRIEGGRRTGLYFEVARGGDGKCPTEASPTPKQIFTIDKIHAAATGIFTKEDGVEIRFFDFEGSLRDEVRPDFADISRVEVVTLDTDAGTSTANVEFTFSSDGGTPENRAHGTLSATYCASFDEEVAP